MLVNILSQIHHHQYIIDKLKDDKKQPKYVLDYFNEPNDDYETDDEPESEKIFLKKTQ